VQRRPAVSYRFQATSTLERLDEAVRVLQYERKDRAWLAQQGSKAATDNG
jgi:hypothetical protein